MASSRLEVDKDTLTDELFAYVTDPVAASRDRRLKSVVVPTTVSLGESGWQLRVLGGIWGVLDTMVLEGVTRREDVAAYVSFIVDRPAG